METALFQSQDLSAHLDTRTFDVREAIEELANSERERMHSRLCKEKVVNRLTTIENAHLKVRIERLKREEQDLLDRVGKRVSAVEIEGRWPSSDPLYQSLFFVLNGVRRDLKTAEKELLRRSSALSLDRAAAPAVKEERTVKSRGFGHNILQLTRLWKQRFAGKPAYQS